MLQDGRVEKKVYKVGKNLAMFRVLSAIFSVLYQLLCLFSVCIYHGSSMIIIGYQLVKIKNISMCNWPFILLAISAFLWPIKAQRPPVTTTETETRTVFVTVDVNSNFVCAKLVNVTGACRRRRGFPIDEPIILSFDDELDQEIDAAFHSVLHPQFVPTRTLGVEVTPVVMLVEDPSSSSVIMEHPTAPTSYIRPTSHVIQPSVSKPSARTKSIDDSSKISAGPRIYFAELNAFFNSIADRINPRSTVTVTITNVFTQTTSRLLGTTATFFVMNCTPSPLPYSTCPATGKKK